MKYIPFAQRASKPCDTATTATDPESPIKIRPDRVSEPATNTATTATKRLARYLAYLDSWMPRDTKDLPPVPPFDHRPERPLAWSAWWDTVKTNRRKSDSKES